MGTVKLVAKWRNLILSIVFTAAGILFLKCQGQLASFGNVVLEERNGLVFDATKSNMINNVDANRRSLLSTLEVGASVSESDYDAAFDAAYNNEPRQKLSLPHFSVYRLEDAIKEARNFVSTFAIFVYDPSHDSFIGLYSKGHAWTSANSKLFTTMNSLAFLLRHLFPERFTPNSPELVLAIGSGDNAQVKLSNLPIKSRTAPVFMFGSVFRDTNMYPNLVPMPMPEWPHLLCYEEWVVRGTVCSKLMKADTYDALEWNNLTPQLIWRGSNFVYLPSLVRPRMVKPYGFKLKPGEQSSAASAIEALRSNYNLLTPRWKGVLLTAESQQEAALSGRELPWANMTFTRDIHREPIKSYLDGKNVGLLRGSKTLENLVRYDTTGLTSGAFMRDYDLSKYKYHIDLGGGGGTTWTGSLQKLAMPGLLFHHITPTKDYIHDRLQPWRHYIPVSHDLSDLKSKFDWAENHPKEAEWIANQGTAFMKHLGSKEGFDEMFQEDLVAPLRQAIEAYQPVGKTHPGMTWREVLKASFRDEYEMAPIVECSGIGNARNSCSPIGGARGWVSSISYGLHRVAYSPSIG